MVFQVDGMWRSGHLNWKNQELVSITKIKIFFFIKWKTSNIEQGVECLTSDILEKAYNVDILQLTVRNFIKKGYSKLTI